MMRAAVGFLLCCGMGIGSPGEASDKRSIEVLNFDCRSDFGSRRLTFFGNGTLRLISGRTSGETMLLAELTPDEVRAYENRLAAEDLSEVDGGDRYSLSGLGVEHCELHLRLWEGDDRTYRFSRLDSLPLNLSRVVSIAEGMVLQAESQAPTAEFSSSYVPQPGDILVQENGFKFEVVGLTGEGTGVELEQLEQPIIIYVPLTELVHLFVRVESRGAVR